jgi:hypothetical protein
MFADGKLLLSRFQLLTSVLCAAVVLSLGGYLAWVTATAPVRLDEYATLWIVQGSLYEALWDTTPYERHPLYYGVIWLVSHYIDSGIQSARFISYIAALLSIVIIGKIVRDHYRIEWWVSLFLFVSMSSVSYFIYARPYPFGFLCLLGTLYLSLKGYSLRTVIASFALCSAAYLFHQSFFVSYVIPLSFFLVQPAVPLRQKLLRSFFFGIASLVFLFLVTRILFPSVEPLRSSQYFFFAAYNLADFIATPLIANYFLVFFGSIVAVTGLSLSLQGRRDVFIACFMRYEVRAGLLIVMSTISALFLASLVIRNSLFTERYMLTIAIGVLCASCAFLTLLTKKAQIVLLTFLCLFEFALSHQKLEPGEDWKASLWRVEPLIEDRTLILIYPGHPTSLSARYNLSRRESSAWTAPLVWHYPESQHYKVLPLVHEAFIRQDSDTVYKLPWREVALQNYNSIAVFIGGSDLPVRDELNDLIEDLANACFFMQSKSNLSNPRVYLFAKSQAPC